MAHAKVLTAFAMMILYVSIQLILPHANLNRVIITSRETLAKVRGCKECLLIIGGSNAVYGISQKVLIDEFRRAGSTIDILNLGLIDEGFRADEYLEWLSRRNVAPKIVVYSTKKILDLNSGNLAEDPGLNLDGERRLRVFGDLRLVSQIGDAVFRSDQSVSQPDPSMDFFPKCEPTYRLPIRFMSFRPDAADKLVDFMSRLQAVFPKARILLRIPPVLIRREDRFNWESYFREFEAYMIRRGARYQFLSAEPPLLVSAEDFCDTPWHPNLQNRDVMSRELATQLRRVIKPSTFVGRP